MSDETLLLVKSSAARGPFDFFLEINFYRQDVSFVLRIPQLEEWWLPKFQHNMHNIFVLW